jgi:5-methylcytosine-specific restriction endonuclease McrA
MVAKRNYVQERKNETPARKKARAARNRARRALGLKVGDPRTAQHKKPLSKGGSNNKKNLTTASKKTNSAEGGRLGRGPQRKKRK